MKDKVRKTITALEKNGFHVEYFDTADAAKEFLLSAVRPEHTVAFGGSNTLEELGLFEALQAQGNSVLWHRCPLPGEDRRSTMKKAMITDVYMSGVNAITEDGRLINVDGTGNRLSSMLFGHDQLYLVAGINKISTNYEEAMMRIRNESAPTNTKLFGYQTPCAVTGKCSNCDSPQRICRATLILEKQHGGIPTTIVLIGESMGF